MLTGGNPGNPGVGTQGKQGEQQPAAQPFGGQVLPAGDAAELVGEPDVVVGLLEDVEQVDGAPAAQHLAFQPAELGGFGELVEFGHADPRLAAAAGEADPASGVVGEPRSRLVNAA